MAHSSASDATLHRIPRDALMPLRRGQVRAIGMCSMAACLGVLGPTGVRQVCGLLAGVFLPVAALSGFYARTLGGGPAKGVGFAILSFISTLILYGLVLGAFGWRPSSWSGLAYALTFNLAAWVAALQVCGPPRPSTTLPLRDEP
jgi:hypothetical protein